MEATLMDLLSNFVDLKTFNIAEELVKFHLPQDCEEDFVISVEDSLVSNFVFYDDLEGKLIFDSDKVPVGGSYQIPITLTNSGGSSVYFLDVFVEQEEIPEPPPEEPEPEIGPEEEALNSAPYFDEIEWRESQVISIEKGSSITYVLPEP